MSRAQLVTCKCQAELESWLSPLRREMPLMGQRYLLADG